MSEDDRRVLAVWAADCAERTLSLFEVQAPGDARARDAIDGLRVFARGECGSERSAPYRSGRTQQLGRSATRPASMLGAVQVLAADTANTGGSSRPSTRTRRSGFHTWESPTRRC